MPSRGYGMKTVVYGSQARIVAIISILLQLFRPLFQGFDSLTNVVHALHVQSLL
jgi:hypothetical protein